MIWDIIIFISGFVILVKGSDILIDGGRSIAKTLNISNWIIGTVIAGIGTSIPELGITFLSATQGQSDIGLGTVIGSNTFNILFILGLVTVIYPITAKKIWISHDLTVNILAILFAGIVAIFPVVGGGFFEITRGEGLILLIMLAIWIIHMAYNNKVDHATDDIGDLRIKIYSLRLSLIMILSGLVGAIVGADWVVRSAKDIALQIGASEALVGLTIVAIGTSLPELAISLRAAYKNNFGISLGNIVGSNIFDFLGILGITALFWTLEVPKELIFNLFVTLGASLLLVVLMLTDTRYVLQRWKGIVMICAYALYLFFLI